MRIHTNTCVCGIEYSTVTKCDDIYAAEIIESLGLGSHSDLAIINENVRKTSRRLDAAKNDLNAARVTCDKFRGMMKNFA